MVVLFYDTALIWHSALDSLVMNPFMHSRRWLTIYSGSPIKYCISHFYTLRMPFSFRAILTGLSNMHRLGNNNAPEPVFSIVSRLNHRTIKTTRAGLDPAAAASSNQTRRAGQTHLIKANHLCTDLSPYIMCYTPGNDSSIHLWVDSDLAQKAGLLSRVERLPIKCCFLNVSSTDRCSVTINCSFHCYSALENVSEHITACNTVLANSHTPRRCESLKVDIIILKKQYLLYCCI